MQRVGLQPARYIQAAAIRYRDMKRHDISISLLGYDMITTLNVDFLKMLGLNQTRFGPII